jgi:hypothetical protein
MLSAIPFGIVAEDYIAILPYSGKQFAQPHTRSKQIILISMKFSTLLSLLCPSLSSSNELASELDAYF